VASTVLVLEARTKSATAAPLRRRLALRDAGAASAAGDPDATPLRSPAAGSAARWARRQGVPPIAADRAESCFAAGITTARSAAGASSDYRATTRGGW
jgi:hypothetical protein